MSYLYISRISVYGRNQPVLKRNVDKIKFYRKKRFFKTIRLYETIHCRSAMTLLPIFLTVNESYHYPIMAIVYPGLCYLSVNNKDPLKKYGLIHKFEILIGHISFLLWFQHFFFPKFQLF